MGGGGGGGEFGAADTLATVRADTARRALNCMVARWGAGCLENISRDLERLELLFGWED